MDDNEIKRRLFEFCEYLDGIPSSKFKGKLSNFFAAYVELLKKYEYLKRYINNYKESEDKCGKI